MPSCYTYLETQKFRAPFLGNHTEQKIVFGHCVSDLEKTRFHVAEFKFFLQKKVTYYNDKWGEDFNARAFFLLPQ